MVECRYEPNLEPYHDGELSADKSRDVEQHLRVCPECAGQLLKARELSRTLLLVDRAVMQPEELERIHDAIDRLTDRSLFRFGVGMSAIAASVLVISTVWLYDAAPRHRSEVISQGTGIEQPWEKLASGGSADLQSVGSETGLARQKDTIDWMIVGLGDQNGK